MLLNVVFEICLKMTKCVELNVYTVIHYICCIEFHVFMQFPMCTEVCAHAYTLFHIEMSFNTPYKNEFCFRV